jgi:cell division protein FtsI/penicillin-binding protein 2
MRQWIAIGAAVGLVAVTLPLVRDHDETLAKLADTIAKPSFLGPTVARDVTPPPLTDLDLTQIDTRGEAATAPAHGKREATLTIVPQYQRAAMGYLREGKVPEGAVVLTEVATGKVLVWASLVEDGKSRDLAAEASAPAASIFKVVTGTALVEAGIGPGTKQCYSGGEHSIRASDLVDNRKRDKYCATLSGAMGRSLNTVFARLALRNLDQGKLGDAASRLGWGEDLPFDVPIAQSALTLPKDELGFARTAAGFWNSTLSPFQAVNLMSTVANGGEMIRLHVVDSVKTEDNEEIYRAPAERQVIRRAMEPSTASAVTSMLEATVRDGTSYKSFHDRAGRAYLGDIEVAGKTGTLTKPTPDGPFYTWFAGFAPSRKPEVAISVLVANRAKWRVKATNVACDMLRTYFADKGAPGVTDPNDPAPSRARKAKR